VNAPGVVGPLIRAPDGALVLEDPVDLLGYQRDCSALPAGRAGMVVRPRDAADVAEVLLKASAERVPVYVRGGGTMYAGGVNPAAGGVVLDMTGLDRILALDLDAGVVVVEPGVRFGALSAALAPHGMTIGIIPSTSPAATIGGAASAHALGTGSTRYQSFADEVVGLEVVLPDGQLLRTGSAAARGGNFFHRYGMGPDLTGLFLGGDASLGVITAIALWLRPLPAARATAVYGFPSVAAATGFVLEAQRGEALRNVWYASGYESATIRGRVGAARPDLAPEDLPVFCVGCDFGGDADELARDQARLLALAQRHGGDAFPLFDELYFNRLRGEQVYWYSFAGYFARSRCGILMASLPSTHLPAFVATLGAIRSRYAEFQWGGAVVLCRRGLHGGVMGFYDEATQWQAVQPVLREAAAALTAVGCIPYKTGKIWAAEVEQMSAWHGTLDRLKQTFDPAGVLSPGNLGLPRGGRNPT
jgi:FAD/FMN-containing dehydrogenase